MLRGLSLAAGALALTQAAAAQDLTTTRVVAGLSSPVWVTAPPSDFDRLFVLEKRGAIRIVRDGAVLPTPFLDIDPLISGTGERGLLGLAFSPDYRADGEFYVNYTDNAGDTIIARYTVSADPDVADPASAEILLTVDQPFANHNAGWIAFGPDRMLYIPLGDGGSGGDPGHRAQNPQELLGKVLRLDVLGAPDPGLAYAIPADNPFVGDPDTRDEIWAIGLRNPWRNDFDPATGDLWIADVGQNELEEINFQPAGSLGGENYGWKCREGTACFSTAAPYCPSSCAVNPFVDPIHEYSHSQGCSITGGVVYRGSAIAGLGGTYFFADFCSNRIWSLRYDGASVQELTDRTAELAPGGGLSLGSIVSFGRDAVGEIYICDQGGEIFKIVGRTCRADLTGDDVLDIFDFLEFQNLFGAGDLRADFTGDGALDLFDFLEFQNAFAAGCP
ncbi:MAG: PQQ-dependent sugar dehydrogenase [Phycisphaerales bacterium JB039]